MNNLNKVCRLIEIESKNDIDIKDVKLVVRKRFLGLHILSPFIKYKFGIDLSIEKWERLKALEFTIKELIDFRKETIDIEYQIAHYIILDLLEISEDEYSKLFFSMCNEVADLLDSRPENFYKKALRSLESIHFDYIEEGLTPKEYRRKTVSFLKGRFSNFLKK